MQSQKGTWLIRDVESAREETNSYADAMRSMGKLWSQTSRLQVPRLGGTVRLVLCHQGPSKGHSNAGLGANTSG
jgi:hypothetical protein